VLQDFKFQTPRPPPVTNPGTPVAPHPLDKLGRLSSLRQLVGVCVQFRLFEVDLLPLLSRCPVSQHSSRRLHMRQGHRVLVVCCMLT
jgi:hypothetical protein